MLAKAHGKVILLGEHACVYGAPALAVALDRGARAEATQADVNELHLGGEVVPALASSSDDRARAFVALLGDDSAAHGVRVEAASDLLPGGGLGSSAALGVAIGRAVTELLRGKADEGEALARATAWERVFHGNPSGIDVAVAAQGGCIRFTRESGATAITPPCDLWLAIGSTGSGASTRAMVDGVAELHRRKPEMVDRAVEGVRSLVDNASLALQAGDFIGLGKLMDLNQMILAGLMVSNEAIEKLCAVARTAGALGAKLTGAGGGGSVVAVADSIRVRDGGQASAQRIVDAFRAAGFDGFVTRVPGDGSEKP